MIPLVTHIITDTIAVDTTTVRRFGSDEMFNYDRELLRVENDDLGLLDALTEWLREVFGRTATAATDDSTSWIWFCIGFGVLAFGLFILFRNRKWFLRNKRGEDDTLDYVVEEDNIYGIDFDNEIAAARRESRYREAVRLVYLSTLRRLSDGERLQWLPQKTPSQYCREVNDSRFNNLTDEYIRVRFGGREATDDMVAALIALRDAMSPPLDAKGGENQP